MTAATVGVVGGQPVVGLDSAEVEILASSPDVAKVGVRELPLVMAAGGHGATTVASTAVLARRAGIRVFATGGIGGVHRGAGQTFDESADLAALGRTPITVVCAGVKSVLDVPATLERLETLGVTVVGYGTKAMPGFFVADSGFGLDWSVDSPAEVAAIMAGSRFARPRERRRRGEPGPPGAPARAGDPRGAPRSRRSRPPRADGSRERL